jgi:tetratricopeptide (TPR) repeat protein
MAIREQLNDPRAVAVSLNAIGQVEAVTDPAAALRTYERALALRRQTGDPRGEMATLLNLADVHRQMGHLAAATESVNLAMALGERMDAPLMKSNALKALAEIDAARGDYAAAYKHQSEAQEARDRIFNQETAAKFHNLEAAQEVERQRQQVLLRDAELARVRMTRTALAIIAALVAVSLGLLYAQKRKLAEALERVQTLRGLLPICAWCKKIRDDKGYWTQVETYITGHSAAEFTHCICPSCYTKTVDDDETRQPLAT